MTDAGGRQLQGDDMPVVGQTFESGWTRIDPSECAKFWVGTRLDRVYGDFDDSYVPGFYLVALLDPMGHEFFGGRPAFANSVNYGCDRLRFTAMVKVGDEVRLACTVAKVEEKRTGMLLALDCEFQLRSGTPALVARWLFLLPIHNPWGEL